MTALSFVWVHPYSQNSGCDNNTKSGRITILNIENYYKIEPRLKTKF